MCLAFDPDQVLAPARYRGSTPLLFHVTIHDLDLIFWYLKQKGQERLRPVQQQGSQSLEYGRQPVRRPALRGRHAGQPGKHLGLPEGNASHLDAYMEILGTQGMAKVDSITAACGSATPPPPSSPIPCTGRRSASSRRRLEGEVSISSTAPWPAGRPSSPAKTACAPSSWPGPSRNPSTPAKSLNLIRRRSFP